MKKLLVSGLAAGLLALSSPGVLAQGISVDAGGGAGVGVDLGGDRAGASGNAGAGVDVDLGKGKTGAGGDIGGNLGAAMETKATGQELSGNTYGGLISALNSNAAFNAGTISSASDIKVVTVSSLEGSSQNEIARLDQALTKYKDRIESLRTSLTADAGISAKLREAGNFSVDDVVGISSGADGSVIVYVDDRG